MPGELVLCEDGTRQFCNMGCPSINGEEVRRFVLGGLGFDHQISTQARDWMLEDKANRIVETVKCWTCTEHVLWERKDKTKPMQLASKGLGWNWVNFYPEAQLQDQLRAAPAPAAPAPAAPAPAAPGKLITITSIGWKLLGTLPANCETSEEIKVSVIQMDGNTETNSKSFTNTFEISASYGAPVGPNAEAKNTTDLALSQIKERMNSKTFTYQKTSEKKWIASNKNQMIWGLTVQGECGFQYVSEKFCLAQDDKPKELNLADIVGL